MGAREEEFCGVHGRAPDDSCRCCRGLAQLAADAAAVHPSHYKAGGLEAIDVIEAFGLNFRLGNAIKYILRAGRKGAIVEDLKKARWYINREIDKAAP